MTGEETGNLEYVTVFFSFRGRQSAAFDGATYCDMSRRFPCSFAAESSRGGCKSRSGTEIVERGAGDVIFSPTPEDCAEMMRRAFEVPIIGVKDSVTAARREWKRGCHRMTASAYGTVTGWPMRRRA